MSEATIVAAAAQRGITVKPLDGSGWLVYHAARPQSHHAVADSLPQLKQLLRRMGVRINQCASYSHDLQSWISAHPAATPDEIERQAKAIARAAGV